MRNPTAFDLTAGQCCDLDGSDVLLELLGDGVEALLADRRTMPMSLCVSACQPSVLR
ncbi:hypothetical protein [Synechococcus sp. PCC 7336]|uniref:hypothetical protein n=1 Tax=Synechococcus sp. PCC 7336 TaxID=195250 RepID=UPI0012EA0D2C|nr:hypothetical protein [Synechococcus sp. PCC 7336]